MSAQQEYDKEKYYLRTTKCIQDVVTSKTFNKNASRYLPNFKDGIEIKLECKVISHDRS